VTDSVEHIKLAYEKLDGDSYNTGIITDVLI